MKRKIGAMLGAAVLLLSLAACGSNGEGSETSPNASDAGTSPSASQGTSSNFDSTRSIAVVSREDGSGTRSAFIELFGIEEEDENGETIDRTTLDADVTNSTSVMMSTVVGNAYTIGYVSLGSLTEGESTVKALKIDGADATAENIDNGTYKVSRPFNIATMGDLSEVAQDFVNFILSTEGQEVVVDNGYIAVEATGAFEGTQPSGKVVVAGSSSVTPVMEKLKEAYTALNPNATIEVQQSDSTTGMTAAIDGICDIGMASRDLKDSEIESGLEATVIATDGIAVIVNQENPLDELTSEQVRSIFIGETTTWNDLTNAS